MIRLYDSARAQVTPLALRDEGRVSIYLCGPTVYDLPHLGHGRHALVWDVLRRWLVFSGLEVRFVSNITDIDDKIIARADAEHIGEEELTATYEAAWWAALDALGVARPDATPHATAYVDEMVELIEELLERDIAYELDDGVYFDVGAVADYGLLAGQSLESLRSGARVEANLLKRSPLDFALWKNAKFGEPSWASPFGSGRPGWHTECVVMSLGLLGDGFDIHGGGLDLKFPHHENERAQAVALGRHFARHWVHHGWVMVGEEKMSKSLGNFTSLTDLLAQTDPRAYRLLVLRSHYRSPIEVSPATIHDAERALARLDGLARRFNLAPLAGATLERASSVEWSDEGRALYDVVATAMEDDLDTPAAVAVLFEALTRANSLADEGATQRASDLAAAVAACFAGLGLRLVADASALDPATTKLVARRDEARASRDWALADRYRDELVALGWIVEDSTSGTVVRRA
ncbi:MAG: cysteine--tRNA ligase [Acidimicrobiales bacterium]